MVGCSSDCWLIMFLLKLLTVYLCLPSYIFQLVFDIRENISHYRPTCVYSAWDRPVDLKLKPTPVIPLGSLPPQQWEQHVHEAFTFIPCHLAVSQIHRLLLLISLPPTVSSATFVCVSLALHPTATLWFRCQGCSHSLPALDHITLPLLSLSPCWGCSMSGIVEPACLSGPVD